MKPLPSGTVIHGVAITNPVLLKLGADKLNRFCIEALIAGERGGIDDLTKLPQVQQDIFCRLVFQAVAEREAQS